MLTVFSFRYMTTEIMSSEWRGPEFVSMRLFHDEDQLCPFDQLSCHRVFCIAIQTSRCALNARVRRKDLFRRGASKSVLAADEQDISHRFLWSYVKRAKEWAFRGQHAKHAIMD